MLRQQLDVPSASSHLHNSADLVADLTTEKYVSSPLKAAV